jgi:alpha-L-fucosidase
MKLASQAGLGLAASAYAPRLGHGDSPLRTKYEATWDSLRQYKVPEWYLDAKFGIFLHWGVYAVPAYSNEWYPREMYLRGNTVFEHHRARYGPQSAFGYKDFIPKLTAANWRPDRWAELFRKAGAKYVVPVGEHHDGFPMYDCSYTDWTAVKMGPRRDIVGDLAREVRKQGLKLGVSSHRAFNWSYYTFEPDFDTSNPLYSGLYGKPHAPTRHIKDDPGELRQTVPQEYLDDWYHRTAEIVDNYQPDLMWFDFCFEGPEWEANRKRFAAFYYNRAEEWGKGVAINYKHQAYPEEVAVLDIERGLLDEIRPNFWQTDTSVGWKSWGYIENEKYKSIDGVVCELVDIVSKNGCLLLNVGPKPDGMIPEPAEKVLLGIGQWLGVNGEAIYGTRPWKIYGEGPNKLKAGYFGEEENKKFTGQDVRFTTGKKALYAICLDWPGEEARIKSLGSKSEVSPGKISAVQLLGIDATLESTQTDDSLRVKMPNQKPCDNAYALKIILNA